MIEFNKHQFEADEIDTDNNCKYLSFENMPFFWWGKLFTCSTEITIHLLKANLNPYKVDCFVMEVWNEDGQLLDLTVDKLRQIEQSIINEILKK